MNLIRQHGEASPFVSARVNIVQERAVAAFERQEFRSVGSRILPMVKRKGTDYRTMPTGKDNPAFSRGLPMKKTVLIGSGF